MSHKPLFVATHPRACSTAFERVFMTRRDILKCVHEPFGDAYYFGPEKLAERYAEDDASCVASGFSASTYQKIMERINQDNTEGKRLFIKDMAQYFFPPSQKAVAIAPSLLDNKRGVGTDDGTGLTNEPLVNGNASKSNGIQQGSHFKTRANYGHTESLSQPASPAAPYKTFTETENPTVVPTSLLQQFHFAFLIRHPRYSIPSYYRCCIPPLQEMTGFHDFRPDEAGYEELRRFFDYLRISGQIGPKIVGDKPAKTNGHTNGDTNGGTSHVDICLIDADDLLDDPEGVLEQFCDSVGVDWDPNMLNWTSEEDKRIATEAFEKWKGFHEDALHSTDLKPRAVHHVKSDEQLFKEWTAKYGVRGAEIIRDTVAENVPHYEYLKQFSIQPSNQPKQQ